jgi:IS30 family transposase
MTMSDEALQDLHDRRRLVASLVRQNLSTSQIAVYIGVSRRTVTRDRKTMGLAAEPNRPFTEPELLQIKQMLADGMCYREIGRTLNRSDSAIARYFPGYSLNRQQVAERASWGRQLARIGV